MADIGNLGNNVGKIYERLPDGSINTYANTNDTLNQVLLQAVKSRIMYSKYFAETGLNTEAFSDPAYGSDFFFNDSGAAPNGSVVGADDVTDYFIVPTKNNVTGGVIVSDAVEFTRLSSATILVVTPQSGTLDNLKQITSDAARGDLLLIALDEDVPGTVVTISDESIDGGNIKTRNSAPIILEGLGSIAVFVKGEFWREVSRPSDILFDVAKKDLTIGGGTYYILDIATPSAQRIKTKRGLVILEGDKTLSASWTVLGESGTPTDISKGTTLDIILDGALVTTEAIPLTIFGIEINPIYALNANFTVRAWWNSVDEQWESRLSVGELLTSFVDIEDKASRNETNTSAGDVEICRTLSHAVETYGLISFLGDVTMAVTLASGAGSKTLYSALDPTFHPSRQVKHMCAVQRSGIVSLTCMVVVMESTIVVYALPNNSLAIGDIIDFSCIKYIAEPVFVS